MIIPFNSLKNYSFSLSDISVICQKPSYRIFKTKKRICNGFIYIKRGKCKYTHNGGEFILNAGSVAYLPFSSAHTLNIISDEIEFYRINFTLKINGEIALFSDYPLKISDTAPNGFAETVYSLCEKYSTDEDSVFMTEKLCTLFRLLQNPPESEKITKLSPAVKYINENFTNEFDSGFLANLCYLSTSQFYKLFKEKYEISPLKYRNNLIIKQAKILIGFDEMSMSEIALSLGFEDLAYFSKFFKKHTGKTPSQYKKELY